MQQSFFFYDYETTGIDPKKDRVIQFAGIRTDEKFNIISEPIAKYCQLSQEIIPHPEALLITGISFEQLYNEGLSELDFTRLICKEFSEPYTCVAGYNNIRFDDEFTRYSFYRNFYDPYAREWQNNNSRWDIIDVVRMCAALRPEGIVWPQNPDTNNISFKLEELTKANGLVHEKAHDALSDVYATIEMAKLIKQAQPRLFDYLLNCRDKKFINKLIDLDFSNVSEKVNLESRLLVHSSRMVGSEFYATSVFIPLLRDTVNQNSIITWDLRYDPSNLLELSTINNQDVEKAKYLLYSPSDSLKPGESRLALKQIFANKVPAIAPFKTLDSSSYDRLQLDKQVILSRAQLLLNNIIEIQGLLSKLYLEPANFTNTDVEHQLYDKFIPNNDRYLCNRVHTTPENKLIELQDKFTDIRLKELLFRYRARNFYSTLSELEKSKWHEYCTARLNNIDDIAGISKQEFITKASNIIKSEEGGEISEQNKLILNSWLDHYSRAC